MGLGRVGRGVRCGWLGVRGRGKRGQRGVRESAELTELLQRNKMSNDELRANRSTISRTNDSHLCRH